jgi:hypothetical protein
MEYAILVRPIMLTYLPQNVVSNGGVDGAGGYVDLAACAWMTGIVL